MTNTKANNVMTNAHLPRRGFFGAIAAAVAGTIGLDRFMKPSSVAPIAPPADERPAILVHPNAVARTEEGSRLHG